MAIFKSETGAVTIIPYTKKEAKAYNDAESAQVALESQPRDGETYIWGSRKVTFTTYGVVRKTNNKTIV